MEMMQSVRRPLCLVCTVFLMAILLLLTLFPEERFQGEAIHKRKLSLTGYVERVEHKNGKRMLQLSHVRSEDGVLADCILEYGEVGALCYLDEDDTHVYHVGSYVNLSGKTYAFQTPTNPGMFDYEGYQRTRGMHFSLHQCTLLGESATTDPIGDGLQQIRDTCAQMLSAYLGAEDGGILQTMLLGDKGELTSEDAGLFREGGISHILAISGLHISLIGMGLYRLLRLLIRPLERTQLRKNGQLSRGLPIARALVCVVVMFLYGRMTGMSSSAFRAIFMFAMSIYAEQVGRTYDLPTALSLAGVCIVLENPGYVYDSGFQMSFGAVAGISLLEPVLSQCIWQTQHKVLRKLRDTFVASLAVLLFTMPISLWHYYGFHPWSLLLNVLIVPSVGVLAGGGLAIILLGGIGMLPVWGFDIVFGFLQNMVSELCKLMLFGYRALAQWISALPGAEIVTGRPAIWQIIMYYVGVFALIFCFGRLKEKLESHTLGRCLGFGAITGLGILCAVLCTHIRTPLVIAALDVGQGDGIVILAGSKAFMVDGGSSSESALARYRILPYLKSEGVTQIAGWFISHPDKDHTSGLLEILEEYEEVGIGIAGIYLPAASGIEAAAEEIYSLAGAQSIPVKQIARGDSIQLGEGRAPNFQGAVGGDAENVLCLHCIHPPKEMRTSDMNACSEVFLLTFGEFSMLLTGDATTESETAYVSYLRELGLKEGVDVLKVGHHGSSTSTSEAMLTALSPQLCIISVGKGNSYGHPHQEVLERLSAHHCKIYRTDQCGAVVLAVEGGVLRVYE